MGGRPACGAWSSALLELIVEEGERREKEERRRRKEKGKKEKKKEKKKGENEKKREMRWRSRRRPRDRLSTHGGRLAVSALRGFGEKRRACKTRKGNRQTMMRTSLLRIQTTLLKMIYKVLLLAHVLDN